MNFFRSIIANFIGSSSNSNKIIVKHLNVPSKYLERGVKVDVFLPPQYMKQKKQRYPTIYFNDGQDMFALGMYDTLTRLYSEGALHIALLSPCVVMKTASMNMVHHSKLIIKIEAIKRRNMPISSSMNSCR